MHAGATSFHILTATPGMSDLISSTTGAPRRSALWATVRVALICAALSFVTWIYLRPVTPTPPRRMWTPVVASGKGQELVIQPPSRRMEFWTPSARTKDHLVREGGQPRPQDRWEIMASDDPVHQFGSVLRSNVNVLGYRRAEVWGHGRTQLKPGWWWTMTVTTNYTVQHLLTAYRDFWRSSNALFVEVIENPGAE